MTPNRQESSPPPSNFDGTAYDPRDNPYIMDFEQDGAEIRQAIEEVETRIDQARVVCGDRKLELRKAEEQSKAIEQELSVKRMAYEILEKIHTSLGSTVAPWPTELPRTALIPFTEAGYHHQLLALANILLGYGGAFAQLVQYLTTVTAIENEDLRKMRQELGLLESQLTAAKSFELVAEHDWHKAVNDLVEWEQELEDLKDRQIELPSERRDQAICFIVYLIHSMQRNIPLPGYATPQEPANVATPSQHPQSALPASDMLIPASVRSGSEHQPSEMDSYDQPARGPQGGGTVARVQPHRACRKRKRSEE